MVSSDVKHTTFAVNELKNAEPPEQSFRSLLTFGLALLYNWKE